MVKIIWKNKEQNEPFLKRSFNSLLKSIRLKHSDPNIESNYSPFLEGIEESATTKTKLITLLKIASEVEHRLMAQYLFTMYSIKENNTPEILATKKALKEIAIQEMGHLLGVQNLLLSIGGIQSLHLHKDSFLTNSKENPLPFNLESFNMGILAGYVIVEAPINVPEELKEKINQIRNEAENHFGGAIKSVGGLYRRIFWMFQKDDNPHSNPNFMQLRPNGKDLQAGDHITINDFIPITEIEKYEAFKRLWNNGGTNVSQFGLTLSKVHSHEDALYLTNYISEQGEGEDFINVDSHFERFYNAYLEVENSPIEVYETPKNLSVRETDSNTQNIIKNNYSIQWVELFNLCYNSLLLDIFSSFRFKAESIYSEDEVVEMLVYKNMNAILGKMSEVLFKLPFNEGEFYYDKEPRCGPTFEIETDFIMSTELTGLISYQQTILERIKDRINKIESHDYYMEHQNLDEDVLYEIHLDSVKEYLENKQNIINPLTV